MIFINSGTQSGRTQEPGPHAAAQIGSAPWIDLHDPTDEERAVVEQATGLRVPSKAELSEIETSSRLNVAGNVLTLSTPMVARADHASAEIYPIGFVLAKDRLLTVRYAELRAFDSFARRFPELDTPRTALGAFVGLLEAIVDRLADVLERVGGDLDACSRRIFRPDIAASSGDRRHDTELRDVLRQIGRAGELVSKLRDSLLGIGRIAGFVAETLEDRLPPQAASRFATLRQDLQSLNDYDSQLTNKVQFLLDATLGFINIQQNNTIKFLTVASVVGIPPTLVASIYGMNFEKMPELHWAFGYPYALGLIVLTTLIPLVWFKIKGWV